MTISDRKGIKPVISTATAIPNSSVLRTDLTWNNSREISVRLTMSLARNLPADSKSQTSVEAMSSAQVGRKTDSISAYILEN